MCVFILGGAEICVGLEGRSSIEDGGQKLFFALEVEKSTHPAASHLPYIFALGMSEAN